MDVRLPDGTIISNVPDGITKAELTERLSRNGYDVSKLDSPKKEQFGERLSREINDIPHQLKLTARDAFEGVGNTLDFFSSPIRAGLNAVLPDSMQIQPGGGKFLADKIGLDTPRNMQERVINEGTKLGFGSIVPMGLASKAKTLFDTAQAAKVGSVDEALQLGNKLPSATKDVLATLASNPMQQGISAASSGLAGQYTKETGGDDVAQMVASLAAGVAAPLAYDKGRQIVGAGKRLATNLTAKPQESSTNIDITINAAMTDSGLTMADLPANIRNSIRNDVQAALKIDGNLSPDAIRRLADYRLTGATPTAATLTLDPAMVSQQKNLAKLGINSKDAAAQQLGQVENANNRQLIANLNELGASNAPGGYEAGSNLLSRLRGFADSRRQEISGLYTSAKDSQGRAAQLDPQAFSMSANNLLDYNLKGAFVPEQIRGMMNDFATGKIPLNVHSAEQFKTIIGNAQRGAQDGNVRAALGFIRQALDNTPLVAETSMTPARVNGGMQLKPLGGVSAEVRQNVGQEAVDAFNRARSANREFMTQVERTPSLAAAIDDAAPDAFFKKHVLNADVRDLNATLNIVGDQGRSVLKNEIVNYLKSKAINGATDEVGNFSQSAYNKALNSVGDQKLSMLFSREEIAQLRAVGRVASYEQFQPRGSAVNNSNTASAGLASFLDRVANSSLLSKIPLGQQLALPAQNISVGLKSNQALSVPRGLLSPVMQGSGGEPVGLLMSPAMFMRQEEENKPRGLLFAP